MRAPPRDNWRLGRTRYTPDAAGVPGLSLRDIPWQFLPCPANRRRAEFLAPTGATRTHTIETTSQRKRT